MKRTENVSTCVQTITEKTKIKDASTGEIVTHCAGSHSDAGDFNGSVSRIDDSYRRGTDNGKTVAHHRKQLKQSNVFAEVAKIQDQVAVIKHDSRKTLEKELKLSTIQTIAVSIGRALGILLLFKLIMGNMVNKFQK